MKAIILIAALMVALAGSVAAQPNWQPLAIGWTWSYENGTNLQSSVVQGSTNVRGRAVREIRHEQVGVDVYRNYWSRDAAGNVYLHGFINDTVGLARSYEPPVLWLPGELEVDASWLTAVDIHVGLEGDDLDSKVILAFRVTDHRVLDLPAGQFDAWGVSEDASLGMAETAFTITGRRREAGKAVSQARWYSHGFGLVKDWGWELTDYTPVAAARATWGDVKALYR
jgi:hypothetical protein